LRKKLEPVRLILIFTLFSIVHSTIRANDLEAKSLRIFPDLESDWFLDGELDFGCEITYSNGGKRRTTGYLNGNIPWNQLVVESEQATAYGGQLLVDLYRVRNNNQTLVIKVKLRSAPHVQSIFDLKVPPIETISIFFPRNRLFFLKRNTSLHVSVQWANHFRNEYSLCGGRQVMSLDSIQIFLNKQPFFDCRLRLSQGVDFSNKTLSISVAWISKPWINDTKEYRIEEHEVIKNLSIFRRRLVKLH
jgi:hypothetical protein